MSTRSFINVWVKGFSPPSKCPTCRRVNTLSFTNIRTPEGFHVYHCCECNQKAAAPTSYAWCTHYDCALEKDVFYVPCTVCPLRHKATVNNRCIFFRDKYYTDLPNVDAITETIRKFEFK